MWLALRIKSGDMPMLAAAFRTATCRLGSRQCTPIPAPVACSCQRCCLHWGPCPLGDPVLACCRVLPPPGLPPADWAALDAAGQQLLRRLQLASLEQRRIAAEQAAVAGAQPGAGGSRSQEVADGLMASAHTNNALLGSGRSLALVLCCCEREPGQGLITSSGTNNRQTG